MAPKRQKDRRRTPVLLSRSRGRKGGDLPRAESAVGRESRSDSSTIHEESDRLHSHLSSTLSFSQMEPDKDGFDLELDGETLSHSLTNVPGQSQDIGGRTTVKRRQRQ
jgi:hypothetical protein